jgi:hypothetical protein
MTQTRDFLVVATHSASIGEVLKDRLSKGEARAWADTVNFIEHAVDPEFEAVLMSEVEYGEKTGRKCGVPASHIRLNDSAGRSQLPS